MFHWCPVDKNVKWLWLLAWILKFQCHSNKSMAITLGSVELTSFQHMRSNNKIIACWACQLFSVREMPRDLSAVSTKWSVALFQTVEGYAGFAWLAEQQQQDVFNPFVSSVRCVELYSRLFAADDRWSCCNAEWELSRITIIVRIAMFSTHWRRSRRSRPELSGIAVRSNCHNNCWLNNR